MAEKESGRKKLTIPRHCLYGYHRGRRYRSDLLRHLNVLEKNFETIRDEAVRCLRTYPVLSYTRDRDFFVNKTKLPDRTGWVKSWPVPPSTRIVKHDFGLIVSNVEIPLNARACPRTMDVLRNQLEGVSVAGFSWLLPKSSLSRHVDRTSDAYTVHLGLIVPEEDDNTLVVFDVRSDEKSVVERTDLKIKETIHQKEGVSFSFDDSFLHEAHNTSTEDRIILYLNIDHEPRPIDSSDDESFEGIVAG